jgi:diguanylate cyclase (GGDEF)-like protein
MTVQLKNDHQDNSNETVLPRVEFFATGLVIFTIIMWLLYEFLLNTELTFDAKKSDFRFAAHTDYTEKGASSGSLVQTDSSLILHYELRPGAPYPFVTLHLDISKNGRGIDLSRYNKILIWINGEGKPSERIRFHLRNFESQLSDTLEPISLKYNEVHLPLSANSNSPIVLTWDYFSVPGWWIAMKNVPFKSRLRDVHNVFWIEFITSEMSSSGKGTIEFKKVVFQGKWMQADVFFKMLLVFWMLIWVIYSVYSIWKLRHLLKQKEHVESHLLQLNLSLSNQTEELKFKAQYDELTSLLNRYGLYSYLNEALRILPKTPLKMSVIMIDIDHFKIVNDKYGHIEGDRILQLTASVLQKNTRKSDKVVRWGGEEFLIVCLDADLGAAQQLANKLRLTIAELPEKITCSFGVATLVEETFQSLLKRADEALYKAKTGGRNCVIIAGE